MPEGAMSILILLEATPESDLVGRFDPDAVSEAIRDRGSPPGESLKNDNGRPFDSLPTIRAPDIAMALRSPAGI
jgi:hypothetical protein